MGNNRSKQSRVESYGHFFRPQFEGLSAKSSAFYNACKEGDIALLRQHLPLISHETILCQVESNGDMALHAAARAGHASIVVLLLANGLSRTEINREGKTAYETAPNDEIRRLFHRSVSELSARFYDENANKTLSILNTNINNEEIFNKPKDAIQSRYMKRFNKMPKFFRNTIKTMTETRSIEALEQIVGNVVFISNNTTGDQILLQRVFADYLNTKNITNLIHLYTLNDIYRAIRQNSDPYTTLVYLHLSSIPQRAYQGICYRGIQMSKFDVSRFYYAMKYNCVIETHNFASTSKLKNVSLLYSGYGEPYDHDLYSILFIFEFLTQCKTAIDLTRVSENLPPISQYSDEEEVLILPYTLFKVLNVSEATENEPFSIYLQNIPVPDQSLISFLKLNPKL
ncbi:hypothetical protein I4U23_017167 [Adineta vaga]|nr:hypothetical protein I4U23_017167 [Adineta vaga]